MQENSEQSSVMMPSTPRILRTYQTLPKHYDEFYSAEKQPRKHWQHFLNALESLGPQELENRRREAQRQIFDNGVNYTVRDESEAVERPWELDPVPVLIDSKEWANIEAGLIQRAELLNQLLKDLYGPRDLIKLGIIPQEVVLNHPGFFRPCAGMSSLLGEHSLMLYGADLVKDESGRMVVIADRTQTPSGCGYALENRMVTSRVLPSLFRDSQVHRLALYFRALRMTLSSIAPHENDDPNIIILSPGTDNETYFEHAYLANYLGYPLAQGQDLTVRNNTVHHKSLNGLQRVDVILRLMDDEMCDPLELRADSQLGVAGLLEAVRAGNVAVANPLGTSALENPGLAPFLPAVARHFLGVDLKIPSAETWWCGKPAHLSHVLSNFDRMILRPIRPHQGSRVIAPAMLSAAEKAALCDQIKANPASYCAQTHLALSTVPAFQAGQLEPRPSVLRSFGVAREDAYVIMPGGLTRIAPKSDQSLISNQLGGICKDTWVLASEPEKQVTLWVESDHTTTVDHLFGSLSSRIAENLFWLGRYAERSEGLIRLLRRIFTKWLESHNPTETIPQTESCAGLQRFIQVILEADALSLDQLEAEMVALMQNHKQTSSLVFNLQAMLDAAQSVRERLSSDTLYAINTIREELIELRGKTPGVISESLEELDALISALMAFSGLAMESLSRDQDWLFLDLGRRVERAFNLINWLDSCMIEPCPSISSETIMLETLLAGSESLMSYRRRFRSRLHVTAVIELLLLDDRHPRSLAYQFGMIEQHIADLPQSSDTRRLTAEQKIVLEMNTRLKLVDPAELGYLNPETNRREYLHQFLKQMQTAVSDLSNVISEHYFSHIQPARQLVPIEREFMQS